MNARSPWSSMPRSTAPIRPTTTTDYVGTRLRAPKEPLVIIPSTLTELTGPAYGESVVAPLDNDLTPAARWRAAR